MPCYSPIRAWKSKHLNKSGKRSLVFQRINAQFADQPISIPCGKCIGCRLAYSQEWGIRAYHESTLYKNNCYLTLTYNDENLPLSGSLEPHLMTAFMKAVRKKYGSKIRFLLCGEYGKNLTRPHYHICLFNHNFNDRRLHTTNHCGNDLYTSDQLSDLWPLGYNLIGDITFKSAAYVARYVTKKITGALAADHYKHLNPEFLRMSRRPGLGKDWYEKYKKEVFPDDFVILDGRKMPVPKFYDDQLLIENPDLHAQVVKRRKLYANKKPEEQTQKRLFTRETCKIAQVEQLKRSLEKETS